MSPSKKLLTLEGIMAPPSCHKLKRYHDQLTAERVLWAMGQQGKRIDPSKLRVMACKECSMWHIRRIK